MWLLKSWNTSALGVHFIWRIVWELNFDSPNVLEKLEERLHHILGEVVNEWDFHWNEWVDIFSTGCTPVIARGSKTRISSSAPFLGTFGQIRKSFCLLAFVEISICWAISDNASPRGKTLQNDGMKGIFCGVSRGIWGETKLLFWDFNLSDSNMSPTFQLSSTATDSSPDTLRRLTLCESRPHSWVFWMRCLTCFKWYIWISVCKWYDLINAIRTIADRVFII